MAKKPDFNLLVPLEYGEGKDKGTRWLRIGALWKNEKGEGYSGTVDFYPAGAGNRIVLMPPKDNDPAHDPETGEIE